MFFKKCLAACAVSILLAFAHTASAETLKIAGITPLQLLDTVIEKIAQKSPSGLHVEYTPVGGVPLLTGLLTRGDVDVVTIITPLGTMPDEAVVFRAHTRHTGFYVLAEKGVRDIRGQTIPVTACEGAGAFTLYVLEEWVKRTVPGIETRCGPEIKGFAGVQFLPVSDVPAQRRLFESGDVHLLRALFPAQIGYLKKGAVQLAGPGDLAQVPAGVLMVRRDRYAQLKPRLERLWAAMQEELDLIEKDPSRIVSTIRTRYERMGEEEALEIARAMVKDKFWSRTGVVTLKEALKIASFYHRAMDESNILFRGKKIPVAEVFGPALEK